MDNIEKKGLNCITQIENTLIPHIGKFGIGLSILGGITSILLGFKIEIPASIVMGLTNVAIFCGSIAFERLKTENQQLNTDCESQRQLIRRFTIAPNLNNKKDEDEDEDEEMQIITNDSSTNRSVETIEPINFEAMHRNNMVQSFKIWD